MNPRVISLRARDSCKKAVRVLLENKVSGVPVLDDEGSLVGVLTESDLMWKEVGAPDSHWVIPPLYLPFVDTVVQLQDDRAYRQASAPFRSVPFPPYWHCLGLGGRQGRRQGG